MSDEIKILDENLNEIKNENSSGDAAENKLMMIKKVLGEIQERLNNVVSLIGGGGLIVSEGEKKIGFEHTAEATTFVPGSARVLEGVFDGQNMIGSDGMQYTVPANYASKSKLVEGDILKLTIAPSGSFIFKQIGPVERNRVIGTLATDPETGDFVAFGEDKKWKILKASVTYFKGSPGDEMVLLVPKNAPSSWAAVENIIKK